MTASATLGTSIVKAALTRFQRGESVTAEFVLLAAHPLLVDLAARVDTAQRHWRVATVTGEVTLRAVLRESPDPVVAVVRADVRLPRDLMDRAYLRRMVNIRADDVMAAAGRRDCDPVVDEDVAAAVFRWAPKLESLLDKASLGQRLRIGDVRALVLAAELDSPLRIGQRTPEQWLAEWILQGPPQPERPAMLTEALRDAHGRHGAALAWGIQHGIEALLTRGALVGSDKGSKLLPAVPPPPDLEPGELAALVERAVRLADQSAKSKADAAVQPAEALAHRVRWQLAEVAAHPLLLGCLDQALAALGESLRRGQAPAEAELAALFAHRSAALRSDALQLARTAARVRRGIAALQLPGEGAPWRAWFRDAVGLGWLDLAIRELRRARLTAAGPLDNGAQAVLDDALAQRSRWNCAFAAALARDWPAVTGANDAAGPLALHHVGRSLVRPLLDAGQRVYLAVLDGCDLSTALELTRDLGERGLVPVALSGGPTAVGESLRQRPALGVGISLVPTVTSHARRALMLGEIPGTPRLDDSEDALSNASNDRIALQQNTALAPFAKRLFLKPDLKNNAEALRQVLVNPGDVRLVVAVWNGVDDALASHETAVHDRWEFAGLGPGALATLQQAVADGWTVLFTADHGHTPYVDSTRKCLPTAAGGRFHTLPTAGSVAFERGPLPLPAVHALAEYGAFHGPQRQGFHGGASLEEVVVPLFAIGRGAGAQPLSVPSWWYGNEVTAAASAQPASTASAAVMPSAKAELRVAALAELRAPALTEPAATTAPQTGASAREARALEVLRAQRVLTAPQLARLLGIPPFLVQGLMATLLRQRTADQGVAPFETREQEGELVYAWIERITP